MDPGAAPKDNFAHDEVVLPKDDGPEGTGQEKSATPGNVAPEEDVAPEEPTTAAPEQDAAPKEDVASEEVTLEEEDASQEDAPQEEDASQEDVASAEGGETYEEKLIETEEAAEAYRDADLQLQELEDEIVGKRNDLVTAEDEHEKAKDEHGKAKDEFEALAPEVYKNSERFLDALLEAKDLRQVVERAGYLIEVLKDRRDKVQELSDSEEELSDSEDRLAQEKERLEADLPVRQDTLEEAAAWQEQAQNSADEARNIFESLPEGTQEEIKEKRTHEEERSLESALEHVEGLLQDAVQEEPAQAEPTQEEQPITGEAGKTDEAGGGDQEASVEEPAREAEVAEALRETMLQWPTLREERLGGAEKTAEEQQNATEPQNGPVVDEGVAEPPRQDLAAEMVDVKQKQDEAQNQRSRAAEEVDAEKKAADEAALRAQEAQSARQVAEQADATEREEAALRAQEADRQAGLAAERADAEKKTAEDAAKQAAEKQTAAEQAAKELQPNNPATGTAPGLRPDSGPGSAGAKPASPGSPSGVIGEAKDWMGVPYVPGGNTRAGADCSGFTQAVMSKFGVQLADSPGAQWGAGTPVRGTAKAGDLVFWDESGPGDGKAPTHVGIADGKGNTIHASNFTDEVSVTPMEYIKGYLGARDVLP